MEKRAVQRASFQIYSAVFFLISLFLPPLLHAEDITRSTELVSPGGDYRDFRVRGALTAGIQVTAFPDTPVGAAQSLTTINGNLFIWEGSVMVDRYLKIGNDADNSVFRTYLPDIAWNNYWTGINSNTANLFQGHPRAEFEVTGNVYASAFRSSPADGGTIGQPYHDQLLHFLVTPDGQWVELGAQTTANSALLFFGNFDAPLRPYVATARFGAHPAMIVNQGSGIYSTGQVGIGTTVFDNATIGLQVGATGLERSVLFGGGIPGAYSSREYKKDIAFFKPADYQRIYSKIDDLNVTRFRYKEALPDSRLEIGLIQEEIPDEIKAHGGENISYTDMIGFMIAGIRGLKEQNDALESEITKLEKEVALLETQRGAHARI